MDLKDDTSGTALKLHEMLKVCQLAAENEYSGIPFEQRGIAKTLETAVCLASDLINEIDGLEMTLRRVSEHATG